MKRLVALLLCLVLLAGDRALAAIAGGPSDTCHAFREEDIWRYFPGAITSTAAWRELNKASLRVDELARSIIHSDQYSGVVLSFFKNAWKIAKENVFEFAGLQSEDYTEVQTREATEAFYRELIKAEELQTLKLVEEVNEQFSAVYGAMKKGQKLTENTLKKLLDSGALREYLGDEVSVSVYRYFCGLDLGDTVQQVNEDLKLAGYALDNLEYALTYAQMVSTDLSMLRGLVQSLDKDDALRENLESYRDYLSTDFVSLYLKDMVLDKVILKNLGKLFKELVFCTPVGFVAKAKQFAYEKLAEFSLKKAAENRATAEDLYKLSLYMQYCCCLETGLLSKLRAISQDGYSSDREAQARQLLMCYIQGLSVTLELCERIRGSKMNTEEKSSTIRRRTRCPPIPTAG